jgi:hypothetical protein
MFRVKNITADDELYQVAETIALLPELKRQPLQI